jgi:hypothetical protein
MHGNGPLWLTVFEGPGNDAQAGQMFVVGRNRPSELNATLRYIVRELSLFPSRSPQRDQHPQWDQEFESAFLQQPVCLSGDPRVCQRKVPHFGGVLRMVWDVRRDVQASNRDSVALSL